MRNNIDFSQHVKEVLNRNNVQIRSLKFVDATSKEGFLSHRKKAILLIRNKVYEREINPLDDLSIDVFDTQLAPYLKKRQLVLVVLPTGGKKRYVLQTSIDNIFVDRFRLIALDPRANKRFSFSRPIEVRLRPVGDATTLRIQTGEVRSVRQSEGIPPDTPLEGQNQSANSAPTAVSEDRVPLEIGEAAKPESNPSTALPASAAVGSSQQATITDVLCNEDGDAPGEDFVRLAQQAPVRGLVLDISCGGMSLSIESEDAGNYFVEQIVTIECCFDKEGSPSGAGVTLGLSVFAVVRNRQITQGELRLSIQFLANLPKAAQGYWTGP